MDQLAYLLFLRLADERSKAPYDHKSPVPEQYGWPSLDILWLKDESLSESDNLPAPKVIAAETVEETQGLLKIDLFRMGTHANDATRGY